MKTKLDEMIVRLSASDDLVNIAVSEKVPGADEYSIWIKEMKTRYEEINASGTSVSDKLRKMRRLRADSMSADIPVQYNRQREIWVEFLDSVIQRLVLLVKHNPGGNIGSGRKRNI